VAADKDQQQGEEEEEGEVKGYLREWECAPLPSQALMVCWLRCRNKVSGSKAAVQEVVQHPVMMYSSSTGKRVSRDQTLVYRQFQRWRRWLIPLTPVLYWLQYNPTPLCCQSCQYRWCRGCKAVHRLDRPCGVVMWQWMVANWMGQVTSRGNSSSVCSQR
jgi:hypothetical protein